MQEDALAIEREATHRLPEILADRRQGLAR